MGEDLEAVGPGPGAAAGDADPAGGGPHRPGDAVNPNGLRWVTVAELEAMHPVRPNPLWWLAYAFGTGLPERHREWVLKDTTCRTWILRHIVRSLVMLVIPVVAVLLFLPTYLDLRILTAITAGGCGLMFMLVHIIETAERRVVRAGYVGGTAERLRHERSLNAQRLANQHRRERVAARRAKRLHGR